MLTLRLLSLLVPRARRSSWVNERHAEFAHFRLQRQQRPDLRLVSRTSLLLSATEDAVRVCARAIDPGGLTRDIGFAMRTLRSTPGFTLVAVLTLALGIGANTAIFTVVNALLLRPLAYGDAHRIVQLVAHEDGEESATVSYPDILDYAQRAKTLEAVAYSAWWQPVYQGDEPVRVRGATVSSTYFRLFADAPALGRYLDSSDDDFTADPSVVVSYNFWQQQLAGDPDAIGQPIEFDGTAYQLVGVTSEAFRDLLVNADAWRNTQPYLAGAGRNQSWLLSWGRVADGVELTTAQAEATTIAAALEHEYPETNTDRRMRLIPIRERMTRGAAQTSLVLLAAVGLVLAIACLNVATLLLTRAAARGLEIAVRQSLGAARSRLVRQLLTESLVLSTLGGIAGMGLAAIGLRALSGRAAAALPSWVELGLDARVLAFSAAATVATGLVFGLAPAWMVRSDDLVSALKEGGRGAARGRQGQRLRGGLVMAELAFSTVLLILAGLMIRSASNLAEMDTGLTVDRVLTVSVTPAAGRSPEELNVFYRQLREQLAAIPQVQDVGTVDMLPLTGVMSDWAFAVEGGAPIQQADDATAQTRAISPGYFETMGIALRAGRLPAAVDALDPAPQVWINETLQQRVFGKESAVGKSIVLFDAPHMIIGVVHAVRQAGPATPPEPAIYALRSQPLTPIWKRRSATVTIRASEQTPALVTAVRDTIRELDATVPLDNIRPFASFLDTYTAAPRLQATLLTAFAALATILATLGIAGVTGHTVAARTAEIGLRRALGAQDRDVARLMFGQGSRLAFLGTTIGLLGAAMLTPLAGGVLFGIDPHDVTTFASAAALLSGVALVAIWLPTRRATKIDPAQALSGQ